MYQKTTEDAVLEAAKNDGPKQVLLMYASERALQVESQPLPPSLDVSYPVFIEGRTEFNIPRTSSSSTTNTSNASSRQAQMSHHQANANSMTQTTTVRQLVTRIVSFASMENLTWGGLVSKVLQEK